MFYGNNYGEIQKILFKEIFCILRIFTKSFQKTIRHT